MSTPRFSLLLVVSMSLFFVQPTAAQDDGWRTIEFETTEVTRADVTVSPDGEWLIFTIVGHLFRLPVEGGTPSSSPSDPTTTAIRFSRPTATALPSSPIGTATKATSLCSSRRRGRSRS